MSYRMVLDLDDFDEVEVRHRPAAEGPVTDDGLLLLRFKSELTRSREVVDLDQQDSAYWRMHRLSRLIVVPKVAEVWQGAINRLEAKLDTNTRRTVVWRRRPSRPAVWRAEPRDNPVRRFARVLLRRWRAPSWSSKNQLAVFCCPECGVLVSVDEDGCCVTCGAYSPVIGVDVAVGDTQIVPGTVMAERLAALLDPFESRKS